MPTSSIKRLWSFAASFMLLAGFVLAETATLKLASPFQSGMVLQRDRPVTVWGWAKPHSKVTVAIDGKDIVGTCGDDGKWSVKFPSMPGGGPHQLTATTGGDGITLDDVLVGDVWIAFGQSNMQMSLAKMEGARAIADDITKKKLPIRCLSVATKAALTPQETGDMTWLGNAEPMKWSAVATVFAHRMYKATGVPTAIIWSAWGSTYIEGWMPIEMTRTFPHFADRMKEFHAKEEPRVKRMLSGEERYREIWTRQRPNIVYNAMMNPLIPYTVSGFLCYQGEANATTVESAVQYGSTLPGLVREYRKRFAQGALPFFAVGLPSYKAAAWPWFRESQSRITELANAHTVITIDTGNLNNIHPADKLPIGDRLSLLARKYVLGEEIEAHGPMFDSLEIDGSKATVTFTHADGLTTDDSLSPATFELAGADRVWHPATDSSISGATVVVHSESVPAPVAVRYAWSPCPLNALNLVNRAGLPTAPFRTDTWPVPGLGE